ncbi:MAG TPA: hypothetical protein VFE62_03020 [Gemmataceae bacterium]|nr:hypothetical protein [Gemmataceae bacterium]
MKPFSHRYFDSVDHFLGAMTAICLGMVLILGSVEYRHELLGMTDRVALYHDGTIVP